MNTSIRTQESAQQVVETLSLQLGLTETEIYELVFSDFLKKRQHLVNSHTVIPFLSVLEGKWVSSSNGYLRWFVEDENLVFEGIVITEEICEYQTVVVDDAEDISKQINMPAARYENEQRDIRSKETSFIESYLAVHATTVGVEAYENQLEKRNILYQWGI